MSLDIQNLDTKARWIGFHLSTIHPDDSPGAPEGRPRILPNEFDLDNILRTNGATGNDEHTPSADIPGDALANQLLILPDHFKRTSVSLMTAALHV